MWFNMWGKYDFRHKRSSPVEVAHPFGGSYDTTGNLWEEVVQHYPEHSAAALETIASMPRQGVAMEPANDRPVAPVDGVNGVGVVSIEEVPICFVRFTHQRKTSSICIQYPFSQHYSA